MTSNKAQQIETILAKMKQQVSEMEELKRDLEFETPKERSPAQARKLIEDIVVPELDVLPDQPISMHHAKKPGLIENASK